MNPMRYPMGMIQTVVRGTAIIVNSDVGWLVCRSTTTTTTAATLIGFGLRNFVGVMRELQINPPGMHGKDMRLVKLLRQRINHGRAFNVPSGPSVVVVVVMVVVLGVVLRCSVAVVRVVVNVLILVGRRIVRGEGYRYGKFPTNFDRWWIWWCR